MPMEYWIDDAQQLIVTRASGVLTDDHALTYLEALVRDSGWRNGMNGFVDLRDVEEIELTSEGIARAADLATEREQRFSGSIWAIITNSEAVYGIARMYELRRNPVDYEVRVYRDLAQALAWLGVDHPAGLSTSTET